MNAEATQVEITDVVGKFGLWQKCIFFVSAFSTAIAAWHTFALTFMAPDVGFTCVQYDNLNSSVLLNNASGWGQCSTEVNGTVHRCVKWEYDKSVFSSTLVEKFDLVCGKSFVISLTNAFILLGDFFGSLIFGSLADRFGRRPTMWIIFVLLQGVNILILFPPNITAFVIGRFIAGGLSYALILTVLVSETVSTEYRAATLNMMWIGWSLAGPAFSGLAYLIRDWFHLQLLITVACVLLLPTMWLVPESPKWLLLNDRKEEAEKVMTKACRWNKMPADNMKSHVENLSAALKQKALEEKSWEYNIFDYLRLPKSRIRTILVMCVWMANAFIYYGISMNSEIFGGNIFMNFFLITVIENPANIFGALGSHHLKRRPFMIALLYVTGITSFLVYPVQNSLLAVRITFIVIIKLCITINYNMIYVYTPETFPTGVRSTGIGLGVCFSRVTGVVGPFVKEIKNALGMGNAMVLFGCAGIFVGTLFFFAPETKGVALPDTLDDSEDLGLHKYSLPCRKKKEKVYILRELP